MLVINLLALGAFCLGFIWGWRIIKKGRMPARLEDSLLAWSENPAPTSHYDRLSGALILVHSLAAITIGFLLVLSVNRAGDGPLSMGFHSPLNAWISRIAGFEDQQIGKLSTFIAALSAGIAAFTCGGLASFPFARWFIRPVPVRLQRDRIFYGQYHAAWAEVGRYQVDRERHLFKLYTRRRPQAPSFVLSHPDGSTFAQVEGTLRELLPDQETDGIPPESRRRRVPAFIFFLVTFITLLGAFLIYRYAWELVWFVYAVVLVAYTASGRMLEKV
jgi:hypothetical protein